jgi:hypothetical protein
MKHTILALLLIGGLGTTADAQRIHNRQHNQGDRIQQGVRSGELTRPETRRLATRERELRQDVRRDRIDGGGLTARERARIENRQDRLSRDIYRQKHDNQSRP